MIVLLSPAKTLDFTSPLPTRKATQPRLLEESQALIEVMRQKSPEEVADLMGISLELAEVNVSRYREFSRPFTRRNARPALLAFAGDVYQGLAARERFGERDYTEAQKVIRILSGLYGLLRPLDLLQPYRLEMGARLRTDRGASLYEFWGDVITELVAADLAGSPGADVVVNLASQEYARAIRPDQVPGSLLTPRFLDADSAGSYRMVSFFAKRARGEMAAWLVRNRVRTARAVREFDGAGYRYDRASSSPGEPTFIRQGTAARAEGT